MPVLSTEPQITINEWDWSDNDAMFIRQGKLSQTGAAVWVDYQIRNRYEKDGHVYMLGVTSPNGFTSAGSEVETVSFCQLASPTLLWMADWTAAKMGEFPNIPDPDQPLSNWVLMDVFYETGQVTLAADGVTPFYRISGTYFYGSKKPSLNMLADICFPRSPWLSDFFERTISSKQWFEKDLINPKTNKKNPPELRNPVILQR